MHESRRLGSLAAVAICSILTGLTDGRSDEAPASPGSMVPTAVTRPVAGSAPVTGGEALIGVGSTNSIAEVRRRLAPAEWQTVVAGKVVTKAVVEAAGNGKEARKGEVLVTAIVNHPPEKLWELMTDYAKYGEFLPKIEEMKVLGRQGNVATVYHQLGIMWVDVAYTLFMNENRALGRISWTLDPSAKNDVNDTTGFYEMVPYEHGRKTVMSYQTWVDTGMAVPAFVENFLTKKTAPQILANIRARADQVFGASGR